MKIVLKNVLKTRALVSPEKAIRISKILLKRMNAGKSTTLDFAGVKVITFVFLYTIFGNIVKDSNLSVKETKRLLSISNATKNLKEQIEYLRDNYKHFNGKFEAVKYGFSY